MRVQVTGLMQIQNEPFVSLRTELGIVSAKWASSTHAPELAKEYDVELDLDLVLDPQSNTREADAPAPRLFNEGNHVIIQATIESVDDDGIAYLRLTRDCLIMAETTGGISVGDAIRVSAPLGSFSVTAIGAV